MTLRECAACDTVLDFDDYSNNQLSKGPGISRCRDRVAAGHFASPPSSPASNSTGEYRVCASCEKNRPVEDYSTSQWYLKALGVSRCVDCVREGYFSRTDTKSAARVNDASDCTYEQRIFAQGAFRNCRMGRYTSGRRTRQPCVVKFFRNPGPNEDQYFRTDAKVVKKAVELVTSWNGQTWIGEAKPIRVNYPEVWKNSGGKRYTVEPFIANFQKFNSNSGWSDDADGWWSLVMQALSHYTYHVTRGHFLLCDLQGGIYPDCFVLTDPVIMSRTAGQFGPTDLGPRGIDNFFYYHQCNRYCSLSWQRPRYRTINCYRAVPGTTMQAN